MKAPGFIVQPFGQLSEQIHVLRSEIQLPVGTAEIEALVFAQLSRRVFAAVPPPLAFRKLGFQIPRSAESEKVQQKTKLGSGGWFVDGSIW